MNIYEFIESKGWKSTGMGRWYKESFHPLQNCWTTEMVLKDLLQEKGGPVIDFKVTT